MKILLRAYLDRNFGDDVMLSLFLRAFPEDEVFLCCTDDSLCFWLRTFPNLRLLPCSLKEAVRTVPFDAAVFVGGSILIFSSLKNTAERYWLDRPLRQLRRHGRPVCYIGCNTGPFDWKYARTVTRRELRRLSLASMRDRASARDFPLPNVRFHIDTLFALRPAIPEVRGEALGISCFFSRQSAPVLMKNAAFLAQMADRYVETTGKDVLLLALHTGQENDLTAAYWIQYLMRNGKHARIVAHLADPAVTIDALSQCRALVAVRYHSAVVALQLRVPILPVAYSNKMRTLIDDLGLSYPCYDWEALSGQSPDALLGELLSREPAALDLAALADDAAQHFEEFRVML